jgi:dTDP-4-dehydrorhamnose 3,5-epimerase
MSDTHKLKALQQIPVQGGNVFHVLKASDPEFENFGEAYFSLIDSGVVKAWKRHTRMTLNLVVPKGEVRFVLAKANKFESVIIGENSYHLLTIFPGVWFGFQGLSSDTSLVLNLASIEHDVTEVERCESSDFDFDWNRK